MTQQKKDVWFLLQTEPLDAALNMAVDEALLHWHSKGKIKPTIRFYKWKKPSLSIGHFQKVNSTIDLKNVQQLGCQLVRRLTGGSAVLHDQELTYSIVVSENHPMIPKTIEEAYFVLAQGIVQAYRYLGIEVELSKKQPKQNRSAVCFETPAIYELIVDGKKISGNAQTRKNGVLLQHGSIPFRFDEKLLFKLFKFSNEEIRLQKQKQFKEKATALFDISPKAFSYKEIEAAFYKGFTDTLQIETKPLTLSNTEWDYIYHLANTKYRSSSWTFRRELDSIKGGILHG